MRGQHGEGQPQDTVCSGSSSSCSEPWLLASHRLPESDPVLLLPVPCLHGGGKRLVTWLRPTGASPCECHHPTSRRLRGCSTVQMDSQRWGQRLSHLTLLGAGPPLVRQHLLHRDGAWGSGGVMSCLGCKDRVSLPWAPVSFPVNKRGGSWSSFDFAAWV